MNISERIFSIRNHLIVNEYYKIITVLGIEFKIKQSSINKTLSLRNEIIEDEHYKVLTIFGLRFKFKQELKTIKQCLKKAEKIIEISSDIRNLPSARGNLKIVQDCSIAALNHFNNICKKYNLKFWLDSGTLIGYVRHNGFIPWDDDIDVCMIRDEYEKLIPILEKELDEGFYYTRGEITRIYYKNTPAQVDIFPYDIGYQKEPLKGSEKIKFLQKLNEIRRTIKLDYNRLNSQQSACTLEDRGKLLSQKNILFQNRPPVEKGFLFYGIESMVCNMSLFFYDDIFPLKSAKFYNIDTFIPSNTPLYLYKIYGDFMNFPKDFEHVHTSIVKRLNEDNYTICQDLIEKYYPRTQREYITSSNI